MKKDKKEKSRQQYRYYAWIITKKGHRVLCSYDKETKQAFYLDEYGLPLLDEYYDFVFDRYATSEETKF